MNSKINTLLDDYKSPTPKLYRRIGDGLLVVGSAITGISAYTMPPWVTAIAIGLTFVGKILSNFPK